AQTQQEAAAWVELIGGILSLIPDLKAAVTDPGTTFGGSQLGSAARLVAGFMGSMATSLNASASISGILGGYARRAEEWQFQLALASAEETQLSTQVEAAKIRVAIAQAELASQLKQIDNAQAVGTFLREKYTNQDLYGWMTGQIASIYFQ